MKQLILLSFLLLTLSTACTGSYLSSEDPETKAENEQFVVNLMRDFREGSKLASLGCPDVQWRHIPALLEFGKSTAIVGDGTWTMPANPLSSFAMTQCSEGMFALWMVEAARLHTLNPNNSGIRSWPSMNPFVQRLSPDDAPLWYINNPEVQQEVLDAYVKWWKAANGNTAAAKTNPLEGTGYMWH